MSFTLHCSARQIATPLLALSIGAHAACPAPAATDLLERFIPADCEVCWSMGSAAVDAPFVLDWIAPSTRGDEAPLSVAALAEAGARAGGWAPGSTLQRRQALPPLRGLSISVQAGPAWYGYLGLQLSVQHAGTALPDGAVGYLALVENVPAGDDGTPIERRLVRALAGPLVLDGTSENAVYLIALRLPLGAKAERLGAVGWIEGPSGRVIALAPAGSPDCPVTQ